MFEPLTLGEIKSLQSIGALLLRDERVLTVLNVPSTRSKDQHRFLSPPAKMCWLMLYLKSNCRLGEVESDAGEMAGFGGATSSDKGVNYRVQMDEEHLGLLKVTDTRGGRWKMIMIDPLDVLDAVHPGPRPGQHLLPTMRDMHDDEPEAPAEGDVIRFARPEVDQSNDTPPAKDESMHSRDSQSATPLGAGELSQRPPSAPGSEPARLGDDSPKSMAALSRLIGSQRSEPPGPATSGTARGTAGESAAEPPAEPLVAPHTHTQRTSAACSHTHNLPRDTGIPQGTTRTREAGGSGSAQTTHGTAGGTAGGSTPTRGDVGGLAEWLQGGDEADRAEQIQRLAIQIVRTVNDTSLRSWIPGRVAAAVIDREDIRNEFYGLLATIKSGFTHDKKTGEQVPIGSRSALFTVSAKNMFYRAKPRIPWID